MANAHEKLRVGLPIRAVQLKALLDAVDPDLEATVRYSRGALIVEEPQPHLIAADDTHPAGGQT